MTREAIPLVVPDVGTFARALGRALVERHADKAAPPGHVELLNLLARAAGHRSYRGLRAESRLPVPPRRSMRAGSACADTGSTQGPDAVRRPRAAGALAAQVLVQRLAMWVLWTQFDGKRVYTEREVTKSSSAGTPGAIM